MPSEQTKLKLKNIKSLTTSVLQDLRQLQKEGKTLPDIIYNYRIQDGQLVRKKEREGSIAGSISGNDDEDDGTVGAGRKKL